MGRNKNKNTQGAKLVVTLQSKRGSNSLQTVSVYDNRLKADWGEDKIKERGIVNFNDLDDAKETLNWCVYGDSAKYQFVWAHNGSTTSTGYAYIFD